MANEFLVQKKSTAPKSHWWKKSPKSGANSFKPRSTILFNAGQPTTRGQVHLPRENKIFADPPLRPNVARGYAGGARAGEKSARHWEGSQAVDQHPLRRKIIFYTVLVLILFGAVGWGLFYSGLLTINDIKIDGTKYLSAQDISVAAWNQSKNNRWLIIPQRTLFGFDAGQMIKRLSTSFNVNKITVRKSLWHTLNIIVQEKPCILVWLEAGHYYCLDLAGEVINITDQAPAGLPLVANQGLNKINGSAASLPPGDIVFMTELGQALPGQINLKIKQYFIDNQLNTVNAQIDGGPLLLFNPQNSLAGQLLKLKAVSQQNLRDQLTKKQYIDLRFGDKAFIR